MADIPSGLKTGATMLESTRQGSSHSRVRKIKHCFKIAAASVAAIAATYILVKNLRTDFVTSASAASGLLGSTAVVLDGVENLLAHPAAVFSALVEPVHAHHAMETTADSGVGGYSDFDEGLEIVPSVAQPVAASMDSPEPLAQAA